MFFLNKMFLQIKMGVNFVRLFPVFVVNCSMLERVGEQEVENTKHWGLRERESEGNGIEKQHDNKKQTKQNSTGPELINNS